MVKFCKTSKSLKKYYENVCSFRAKSKIHSLFNKQVFDTKLTDFLDKETVFIHEAFYCVNKNLTYAALLFSLILFQLNFSMRQSEPEELYLKSCLIKKMFSVSPICNFSFHLA